MATRPLLWTTGRFTQLPSGQTLDLSALPDRLAGAVDIRSFNPTVGTGSDDSATVTAALAAGRPISIPAGMVVDARSISQAGITGLFTGPGQIKTSDGTYRMPTVVQIYTRPAKTANFNVVEGGGADLTRVVRAIEHRVGADALGYPTTGYQFTQEVSLEIVYAFNSGGWNNSTGPASSTSGRTGYGLFSHNLAQAGQGDASVHNVSITVSGVKSGATSFLANAAGTWVSGAVAATAAHTYLQFIGDINFSDNGFDCACIPVVLNFNRSVNTASLGETWTAIRTQSVGTKPMDAFLSAFGNWTMLIDAVDSSTTAPLVMKAGQMIYGNGTQPSGTPFASTVVLGTATIGYSATLTSWEVKGGLNVSSGAVAFAATPTFPTVAFGDNTTNGASTAFVAAAVAAIPKTGSATLSFGGGAIVANGTYEFDVPYTATVSTLKYKVGSAGGSFTATVTINGTNVTGLSAIPVNSNTVASASATGANAITATATVAVVISAVSGSPTDARLVVTWTHA